MVENVARLLTELERSLDVENVVVACHARVLEVVYAEKRDGRLLISDRGETAQFFEQADGPVGAPGVHRAVDVETIRATCEDAGARLVPIEDMSPHITIDATRISAPDLAVQIIADAMDRVAALGYGRDKR